MRKIEIVRSYMHCIANYKCPSQRTSPSLRRKLSIMFPALQQHDKTLHTVINLLPALPFSYLGEVEDTTPTCTKGRPGSFVCSGIACRRAALCGLTSRSCCMSLGSTEKTFCRSPFSFRQADAESALALPDCCS